MCSYESDVMLVSALLFDRNLMVHLKKLQDLVVAIYPTAKPMHTGVAVRAALLIILQLYPVTVELCLCSACVSTWLSVGMHSSEVLYSTTVCSIDPLSLRTLSLELMFHRLPLPFSGVYFPCRCLCCHSPCFSCRATCQVLLQQLWKSAWHTLAEKVIALMFSGLC